MGTSYISADINNHPPRSKKRKTTDYQVFLLRMWTEDTQRTNHDEPIRLSLEDTRTGTRHGFTEWGELMNHLKSQLGESPPTEQ